jgi:hypothetical protein
VTLHDRQVEGVAGGQSLRLQQDVARSLNIQKIDCENLVNDLEKDVERWLDRLAPSNRVVAMQDLLEHLGVRHQTFLSRDRTFQQLLCFGLVRVGGPDEIHRDVGVDENHAGGSKR